MVSTASVPFSVDSRKVDTGERRSLSGRSIWATAPSWTGQSAITPAELWSIFATSRSWTRLAYVFFSFIEAGSKREGAVSACSSA
ncbi:MAG: hypothetical protein K0T01_1649 [Acidimicrobiia bacterium]|nr:hypothetical protein [Acidimicrobiia bacterium]